MEPLSPRAANIQAKPKASGKMAVKPSEAKKVANQKEHAPKPPAVVVQPPLDGTSLSESYRTGNHLGKGGFAVCYEGELQCRNDNMRDRIYALKIVPAKMNHKKMEDKVVLYRLEFVGVLMTALVPNRASDTREAAPSEHRGVPPSFYIQRKYICCPRALSQRIRHGIGQEARMSKLTGSSTLDHSTVWSCQIYACQKRDTSRPQNGQPILRP